MASDLSLQHRPWEPGGCHRGLAWEQGRFEAALGGPAGGRPQATLGGLSQAGAAGRRQLAASGGIQARCELRARQAGVCRPRILIPQFSGAESLCFCLGPGSLDSVVGKGPNSGDRAVSGSGGAAPPGPSPPVLTPWPLWRREALPGPSSFDPRMSRTSRASGAGAGAEAPPAGGWRSRRGCKATSIC